MTDTTDRDLRLIPRDQLPDRLRAQAACYEPGSIYDQAAAEIERLRKANAELWDRYERILNQLGATDA